MLTKILEHNKEEVPLYDELKGIKYRGLSCSVSCHCLVRVLNKEGYNEYGM